MKGLVASTGSGILLIAALAGCSQLQSIYDNEKNTFLGTPAKPAATHAAAVPAAPAGNEPTPTPPAKTITAAPSPATHKPAASPAASQPPYGYPAELHNILAESLPYSYQGRLRIPGFPRVAIKLTRVTSYRPPSYTIAVGCAVFNVREWTSNTHKNDFEFTACSQDFYAPQHGDLFLQQAQQDWPQAQVNGGFDDGQHQPLSMHFGLGPKPPRIVTTPILFPQLAAGMPDHDAWVRALESALGDFLEYIGFQFTGQDERAWLYQVDDYK